MLLLDSYNTLNSYKLYVNTPPTTRTCQYRLCFIIRPGLVLHCNRLEHNHGKYMAIITASAPASFAQGANCDNRQFPFKYNFSSEATAPKPISQRALPPPCRTLSVDAYRIHLSQTIQRFHGRAFGVVRFCFLCKSQIRSQPASRRAVKRNTNSTGPSLYRVVGSKCQNRKKETLEGGSKVESVWSSNNINHSSGKSRKVLHFVSQRAFAGAI